MFQHVSLELNSHFVRRVQLGTGGHHKTPIKDDAVVVQSEASVELTLRLSVIWFSDAASFFACDCLFLVACQQDKLSVAVERVQLQTEEATLFQRQTNEKILLIKVSRCVCVFV